VNNFPDLKLNARQRSRNQSLFLLGLRTGIHSSSEGSLLNNECSVIAAYFISHWSIVSSEPIPKLHEAQIGLRLFKETVPPFDSGML